MEGLEMEIGDGEVEEGGCEQTFLSFFKPNLRNMQVHSAT